MSRYSNLLEENKVTKNTLCSTLYVLFLLLKCTYMKHQWGIISVREVTRKRVRELIGLTKIKNKMGRPTKLLIHK